MVADKEAVQFPSFNSCVCYDEFVSVSHEGVVYQATIRFDEDSHIDDDDVHNPDQAVTGCDDDQFKKLMEAREAWFDDDWWYGWIEVTSTFNGYKLKSTASVSRVEVNYPGSRNEYLSEAATELLSNLITEVDDELDDMMEMLRRRIALLQAIERIKMTDCCICGEPIKPDPNGWHRGHNARPVKEGQCCLKCNNDVVVPARIAVFMDRSKPKTFVRLSDLAEQDTSPNSKGEANGCTETTTDGSA